MIHRYLKQSTEEHDGIVIFTLADQYSPSVVFSPLTLNANSLSVCGVVITSCRNHYFTIHIHRTIITT